MAQNYIESGERLDYTVGASETITSGGIVIKNDIIGIALGSGTEGDVVAVALEGVFELTKKSTDTPALGAKLYWDAVNSEVTTTSTSNTLIGVAWAAAGNGDTTVKVRLKY